LAELLPNIIFVTDALGQATYFNQRTYDYTGLTPDQARDGGWLQAIHPDDAAATMEAWLASVETGMPYEVEYRIRAADGSYRWFIGRGNPVRAEDGTILRWVGSCTDIEREKELASALRDNVAWFESLANTVPQLIWISNVDGRVEYLNARWSDVFDASLEAIQLHGAWPYIHPDDRDEVERAWSAARASKTVWDRELRMRVKDGTYRWFLVRGNPIEDHAGTVVRWFGTTTDIDAQRRTVEDLSENVEYVRLLTEVLPAVLWTAAPDGRLLSLSNHFYELTGRDPARPLETWVEALHPEDYEAVARHLRGVASRTPFANEYRLRAAAGSYRWHYTKATPILDSNGHLSTWVGITFDTETLRQRQESLEADFEREQQASRVLQNAALRKNLPAVPGLSFNTIYRPADSAFFIGGDWYDAFSLRDGSLILSVGDAMGSGISSSTTMSAARRGVRSVAQVEGDPSRILDAVDEALRLEEHEVMATAFVGRLDLDSRTLAFASAGHLPALVRYRDGRVAALEAGGFPLGCRQLGGGIGETHGADLSDADLLVLYTDGLIESQRDILEGERKLRAALGRVDLAQTPDVATFLVRKLVTKAIDDLAILVVRLDAARPSTSSG
jgi:PAS domain S-box-containing protein